ncbi:hypothetical protein T492DRAFT_1135388 [Pavlovales sp. CCMP2436]|nr:hypothetical protein T492DRAFT_1135388 [Pavlovales sp. CCMP2436]
MIFSNSDIVYDILFFAGSTQIAVDPEASSNIAFYSQIYRPVLRICGGVIVNSIYTGVISPISRDLIARGNNGETYNIVDNLELLNSELLINENVTILSCTAASDSRIVLATPAYNPSVIGALNKISPPFTSTSAIGTDPNWPITTGWRITQSSIYQNNGAFFGWKGVDRVDSTYWASGETTYTSSGVGNQWVQMEFPEAVKMVSHTINPRNTLNVGVPLQWTLSGSNNNSSFVSVETFQFNSWQANKTETFITSQSHVAYKYWRITITRIQTSGAAIHAVLYDLAFNTGWSIGMPSLLSAQPIDLNSFKLVLGNSYDTPVDWQFNLMLLKNNKIVNSGLYNLSLCLVSPSLTLDSLNEFTIDSPTFTNNVNIITAPRSWRNADGWRLVTSSTFQNNPLYAANAAMDKRVDTWWGSSENTYTSAGPRPIALSPLPARELVCAHLESKLPARPSSVPPALAKPQPARQPAPPSHVLPVLFLPPRSQLWFHTAQVIWNSAQGATISEQLGNRYEEPGDPPSLRRIPNSQTGFERVYNRMMRDAKKNEHTPSTRNNKYTTLFDHTDYADRGINLKHRGSIRQSAGDVGEKEYGFSRQARVKIAKPKDLEGIMDLRYTEEDEKKDNEKAGNMVAESDKEKKRLKPPLGQDVLLSRLFDYISRTGFYHRLSIKKDQIEDELKLLPVQRKGRPKAGEIRDAKSTEEKKRLNWEHKNITKRADDLLALNERIIQLSGANALTIISPLYPKFGSYLHVDNPNPITGKVHGVIKTPVKMLLTTPTHVESFDASTLGFVTTDSEIIKLDLAEMTAKHAELIKSDGTLITYPSSNQSCPHRILRSDGTVFELYDTFPRGGPEDRETELDGDDAELRQKKPRITAENIINIDQSKAYTRAFDQCMTPFLASPGCCIGKISEVFALSSHEEMKDMLSQKIEGLLAINTSTVDFSTVCSEKIIEYLRTETPDLNTDYITAAKIHETLTNVYTTKIARSYEVDDRGFYKLQAPTVPKILTFPEARFWLMCGVTFEAHIAMVSYDTVPISWDDTSHTKEGGIRHYAKAVGVGMSTSLNSRFHMSGTEVQAQQYYALALEDPNLDETRVHIRTVGENTIEIEHPLGGVNTTAHAVCQAFVLPSCLELVTDGIYCLMDRTLDYERLLLPTFMIKDTGSMPDVAATPTLSNLRVDNINLVFHMPDYENKNGFYKPRNKELLGPLSAASGYPAIITGGRVFTEERTRDLNRRPPANIIVDEATMLTQKQRLKIEEFAKGWDARLFFLGDYCPLTSIPMQCQPVDSASMNLEGLRRYHVEGVKRTSDPLLMVIQEALRYVIGNTSGGLFFANGYGADPVDAVMEARDFIFNALREEQHSSVYKACGEIKQGDIILAATRVCPHCGHTAVEKCTCMTAKTLDDVNFISKAKKELYIQRNTKSRAGGGGRDGGLDGGFVIGAEIGGEEEKEIDLWPLSAYSSVALEYARELADHGGGSGSGSGSGDVEWKCTKTIRGTILVDGTRFTADRIAPTLGASRVSRLKAASYTWT